MCCVECLSGLRVPVTRLNIFILPEAISCTQRFQGHMALWDTALGGDVVVYRDGVEECDMSWNEATTMGDLLNRNLRN